MSPSKNVDAARDDTRVVDALARDVSDLKQYQAAHAVEHHHLAAAMSKLEKTAESLKIVISTLKALVSGVNARLGDLITTVGTVEEKLIRDNNGGNIVTRVTKLEETNYARDDALAKRSAERRDWGGKIMTSIAAVAVLAVVSMGMNLLNMKFNNRVVELMDQQAKARQASDADATAPTVLTENDIERVVRRVLGLQKQEQSIQNPARSSSRSSKSNQQKARGGKPMQPLGTQINTETMTFDYPVPHGWTVLGDPGSHDEN